MLFSNLQRTITSEDAEKYCLQYYDSDVHSASFVLPRFARKVREGKLDSQCCDNAYVFIS